MTIRFEGSALEEPANRDCVEHLAAVLGREMRAYAESHGGDADLGAPSITKSEVTVSGLGAAAAGQPDHKYTSFTGEAGGYWHLPALPPPDGPLAGTREVRDS